MALIIENGTIVTGANSYVTALELTAYATARGITISDDEEQLLIRAMDYIESLVYQGVKSNSEQSLQWPRYNVVIDDYLVSSDAIPNELKKGQIEVALAIDNGQDPQADIARLKSSVKVGEIAVTYEASQATTLVRKISNSLYKLLASSLSGGSFTVLRG